jgi:hypothetical protein
MARTRRLPRTGMAWVNQIFQAGQVAQGNIIRRSTRSVSKYTSPELLEQAVRARGFHMAVIGAQYVIVCNTQEGIKVIC